MKFYWFWVSEESYFFSPSTWKYFVSKLWGMNIKTSYFLLSVYFLINFLYCVRLICILFWYLTTVSWFHLGCGLLLCWPFLRGRFLFLLTAPTMYLNTWMSQKFKGEACRCKVKCHSLKYDKYLEWHFKKKRVSPGSISTETYYSLLPKKVQNKNWTPY